MLAHDLISETVPSLRTSDTGTQALNLMETYKVSHLPVVNNEEFLGLISDSDIYDHENTDDPIGNHNLSLVTPFVFAGQHIYEVIELLDRLQISVVPVLNRQKHYLGVITARDLVQAFAKMATVHKSGTILVLEMNIHDYSLSQIAQIVESNNTKILSMYVSANDDTTKINITLKLDSTDAAAVIQTFERYNYTISGRFLSEENEKITLFDRYQSLLNYLNM
ncbi:MAG TPA: CBS domain-containing protein [Bacteroidales bacterium]|nr:CBS domain-containing protein [Bacteroidales bacterium]HOE04237.1 CBS domain-containing protein [Bacteroidales bacterium]HQL70688.1 CBS domain-containing protein [Bacteroidales bacterium]